ncbi:YcaO-like family protein [Kitasatospora sp. NPDC088351]|uniref:YcaO-like family protein n=1 Tax=Kitasatospora sp. NPDC088351 TaxID=3155180 RepID=UPI00343B62E9
MTTSPRTTTTPVQAGERELDLVEAWSRGQDAAAEAGLAARLSDRGDAWRCDLLRTDGSRPPGATGSGKGDPAAARVGALFEALEHYHSHAARVRPEDLVRHRAGDLAAGELADEPGVPLLARSPAAGVACRRHTALCGTGTLDVPLLLTCPSYVSSAEGARLRGLAGDTFAYASASRYSNNSGTASGASTTEAVVHALAETVERDAFSLLLVDTFLAASPARLRLVDPGTLPDALAALLGYAERRVGRRVRLIEMTTDLRVPAYCAHAAPDGGFRFQGYGASLSAAHAVRRALRELLQISAPAERALWVPRDFGALRRRPRLLAAGRADFGPHLAGAVEVPFRETAAPATARGHLDDLVAMLGARGFRPFACVLHRASNGVSTVSTYTPGLERFLVVTGGNAVVPGPRGRAVRGG